MSWLGRQVAERAKCRHIPEIVSGINWFPPQFWTTTTCSVSPCSVLSRTCDSSTYYTDSVFKTEFVELVFFGWCFSEENSSQPSSSSSLSSNVLLSGFTDALPSNTGHTWWASYRLSCAFTLNMIYQPLFLLSEARYVDIQKCIISSTSVCSFFGNHLAYYR